MQNPLYTYDEYLICIRLGPSISTAICKNPSYSGPSYPSSPVNSSAVQCYRDFQQLTNLSLHSLFCREEDGQWVEEQKLEAHSDWVRDVAWAPSIGLPKSIIASCSQVRKSLVLGQEFFALYIYDMKTIPILNCVYPD